MPPAAARALAEVDAAITKASASQIAGRRRRGGNRRASAAASSGDGDADDVTTSKARGTTPSSSAAPSAARMRRLLVAVERCSVSNAPRDGHLVFLVVVEALAPDTHTHTRHTARLSRRADATVISLDRSARVCPT